ncbi:MAG: beta-hydroxyacyl-ACP dehydratase [Deltaproteobacteria bacterium]|nr:beta-hydroxyacyl-ACP dehydratase [Deltaproteobacteria bacterium]
MAVDQETKERVLRSVPQQYPFRFIDEILELDAEHIVGAYRFRHDEYFYKGHFPGRPITPGVILIETMAQTGVVAFGLYLTMEQGGTAPHAPGELTTLFTLAEGIEFTGIVRPGERVIVHGQKVYFRMGNLKANVRMHRENGQLVSSGTLAGMGISL